jgi:hypothetical protein
MTTFVSEPHDGQIFIAERSRRGSRKLLWSVMPEATIVPPGGNPAVVDRVITATGQDAGGVDVGQRSSATVSRRASQLTRPFMWP